MPYIIGTEYFNLTKTIKKMNEKEVNLKEFAEELFLKIQELSASNQNEVFILFRQLLVDYRKREFDKLTCHIQEKTKELEYLQQSTDKVIIGLYVPDPKPRAL